MWIAHWFYTFVIFFLQSSSPSVSQQSSSSSQLESSAPPHQPSSVQVEPLDDQDNVILNGEVETLFMDQIESKLNDFEDLKTQVAVLDRHMRKHSNPEDLDKTGSALTDFNESISNPLQHELKALRKEMIEFKSKIDSKTVLKVNTIVDKAETFLESGFDKVNDALDAHLASDLHKHEHDHGDADHGHAGDSLADYADLISVESEVDIEDKDLLLEYIDLEINEFENIKEQKIKLSSHLKAHQDDEHLEDDDLQLKIAENVLQELDPNDINSYENSLINLKNQIMESNGKLKLEAIDKIAATMEKAEIFIETSNDKLELVELLDEEFEEFHDEKKSALPPINVEESSRMIEKHVDDGHFLSAPPTITESTASIEPVEQYSTNAIEALKKAADESHNFLHAKNLAHHTHVIKEAVVEDIPLTTTFALTVVFMVLLAIVVAVLLCASRKKSKMEDACEAGPDVASPIHSLSLGRGGQGVPRLVLEKEMEGRNSRRRRK